MMRVIKNAVLVNEGQERTGGVIFDRGEIISVFYGEAERIPQEAEVIDAEGAYLLPGVIDDHVHFREPGLTDKADIESESRAAAAGGVTSFFDMPNTNPQTTTIEAWEEKNALAATKSHVNYAFFFGATNDNAPLLSLLDKHRVPGVKLFMGSSTGNMLVDRDETLKQLFSQSPLPIMAHCEDTEIINEQMRSYQHLYGDDPDVIYHPQIRSEEACYQSTKRAVELARETGARLHVAHLSTARELQLIPPYKKGERITAEVVIGHLMFSDEDYPLLGSRIKVNPSIKSKSDQQALRQALSDAHIAVVGTDHAPHLLSEKEGGSKHAVSGMPIIQYSLVSMLELVDEGVLTLPQVVALMCHHPADIFEINKRGYLRAGYKADMVMVRRGVPHTVTATEILSKCGWSPMEGHTFAWKVEKTFCNGYMVYDGHQVDTDYIGQELSFR